MYRFIYRCWYSISHVWKCCPRIILSEEHYALFEVNISELINNPSSYFNFRQVKQNMYENICILCLMNNIHCLKWIFQSLSITPHHTSISARWSKICAKIYVYCIWWIIYIFFCIYLYMFNFANSACLRWAEEKSRKKVYNWWRLVKGTNYVWFLVHYCFAQFISLFSHTVNEFSWCVRSST